MLTLRPAEAADLEFLVWVDLDNEGYSSKHTETWDAPALATHRDKITAFLTDANKAAWVYEDTATDRSVAMILWRNRNRLFEKLEAWDIIGRLNADLFPPDGAFYDIYQLWVAPEYRRRGLASNLKRQVEVEARRNAIRMLLTKTEASNRHLVELNLKLGYEEVWRGPIWDEVVRVVLIKLLA